MILWKSNKVEDLIMVYGFVADSPYYDAVLTLYVLKNYTYAYGFNSKVSLKREHYQQLFSCICDIIPTQYLVFETLFPVAQLFRIVFNGLPYQIVSEEPTKTFDGYDSVTFTIKMKL